MRALAFLVASVGSRRRRSRRVRSITPTSSRSTTSVSKEQLLSLCELIDGEPLRKEMQRSRLPIKRVLEIAHQIAEGLTAADEAGIVHRDLKPENVMVTATGHVKMVEFGLAKTDRDPRP